ncbi:NAD(P)/FAD-dependent oxidoreductase [Rhizorhabdus dicambivorans]|uniref:FAD-dependent oxidoreductase n=1 Tax=Rhizorhabdus dicambivorans TaxID=1850238 RepID=A0A2A4FY86_9SPHN|nr:NAD(P)/FAD-dependent oxidoreductase [Rhizorhabdus dicambivorans]ATE64056.1 FAD-dependent oxidoreductase [Rhizorhabdus dicambivorans]PCE42672.1 FAD-dependent oxidoreductase [Rhizorhabdus dicambivorans]
MSRFDAIVIGAGVIGLAIARSLARAGRAVLILEREGAIGTGISSRNSGVIHAGLYYPPGSWKARLCREGRGLLYAYCEERQVAYRRCGKLVVARNDAERPALEAIVARAGAAGGGDLLWLDGADARRIEPALDCASALLSPSSGIVDAHGLMLALLGEAEDHGAMLARLAPVDRVDRAAGAWLVHAGGERVAAPLLVNAAGLDAQAVAGTIEGLNRAAIPPCFLAKGHYFSYAGRVPFDRLIYPVPVPGGLGTHLTLDLAGQARFGPDVEWIDAVDWAVDPGRKDRFVAAASRLWPGLDPDRLQPGYAGIRPKLVGPGDADADFRIDGEAEHGMPGLVNLFGIESPGLTASLAIGDEVAAMLAGRVSRPSRW